MRRYSRRAIASPLISLRGVVLVLLSILPAAPLEARDSPEAPGAGKRYDLWDPGGDRAKSRGFPPVGKAGEFTPGFVASECAELDSSAPLDHYRFFRFHTDLDFDEPVPGTIVVTGGVQSKAETYVRRSSGTLEVQRRTWRSWVWFLYVALFGLLIVLTVAFVTIWISRASKEESYSLSGIRFPAVCALLVLISGYLTGSSLVVDNATETDLQVQVNGGPAASLPAGHYFSTRVSSGDVTVEVFNGGRMVESARLSLDNSGRDLIVRAFRGRGTFVYNIAAANSYVHTAAGYTAR